MIVKKIFADGTKKSLLSELTREEAMQCYGGADTGVNVTPFVAPPPQTYNPPSKPIGGIRVGIPIR
jgi:hypothetical protein